MLNNRERRPTHPGEILREDILPAININQTELAKTMGVSRRTISEIIHERRPVSPDIAHRLAKVFHTSPEFWLNLQQAVDIWDQLQTHQQVYDNIKPIDKTKAA